MTPARLLIVEDELIARENLEHVLHKEGYDIVAVESGAEAFQELDRAEYDLVLTDLRLPGLDGMQVLQRVKEVSPNTEVIMITGYATVASAVEAMQKGAYHYLAKPFQIEEMRVLVRQALEKRRLRQEVAELKRQVQLQSSVPLIIGQTPKMVALKETIRQIAPLECTVLILGETGTGKELVAKSIHSLSPRAEHRFVAINCGAFTEELLANELFGHEKEAFTGARGVKRGFLEVAAGGTLFLDEIGEMPATMQVKLLRVLQEKSFFRVGGTLEVPVDIRILAATNKDLRREVEQGNFRQDLYYRLNVVTLEVPPLGERRDDIPLLCQHFLTKFAQTQGKDVARLSAEALDILMSYEFPGNVRELENILERAAVLSQGKVIEAAHLPMDLQQPRVQVWRRTRRKFPTLEEQEKDYIFWVLMQVEGNRSRAAEILGIDRVSLWRKLKRYGLSE